MEASRTLWRALIALVAGLGLALACGKAGPGKTTSPVDPQADGSLPDGSVDGSVPDENDGAIEFGTPGPWPLDPITIFGADEGLLEQNIVEASTDEAQNIWAASHEAVYVMRPGESRFRRYTGEDGLNLANALSPGIRAICGGKPNEAFVGYQGSEVRDPQHDPDMHRGKLDRVLLREDGTLEVTFYDVHNNDDVGIQRPPGQRAPRLPNGLVDPSAVPRLPDGRPAHTDWSYNENRTVQRFLYDHIYHRGTLYVGYNHGVGRIDAGKFDPVHTLDYADHVHPDVTNAAGTKRMGDWSALALDPFPRTLMRGTETRTGMLWMGGRWTAGARHWTPGLWEWTDYLENPFRYAFTSPPVFPVAEGDDVYISGIAALSDGTVYFASGPLWGFSNPRGIAALKDDRFTYLSPEADLGLPARDIIDLQRLPDDTVLIALRHNGLWRWNPMPFPGGRLMGRIEGLPGGRINRVYVDQMVAPTAVYVATDRGFALLRLD
ncbi:MAG: hypothetical protein ACOX6T_10085 [Myxococcales bacterium]|jgi:hypothetical protein